MNVVLVGTNLNVKSLVLASCECDQVLSSNISMCGCCSLTDELTTHSCPVLRASELCIRFTHVQNADTPIDGVIS